MWKVNWSAWQERGTKIKSESLTGIEPMRALYPLSYENSWRARVHMWQAFCILLIKPWPNGVVGRLKLRTWVYLRLRLARACAYLRWLAMTCAHFGRDQICKQVKASFSPFGHPTQVSTQVQLVSTCDYLPVRLARALQWSLDFSNIQRNETKIGPKNQIVRAEKFRVKL